MKNKTIKLGEDLVFICELHRCNEWKNSWMWNKRQNELKYYHLITFDLCEFYYRNINDTSIEVKFEKSYNKFRIDVKTRYKGHNFWLFDEKDWLFVEKYVKNLVKIEYDSLEKLYSTVALTDGAYMEREPFEMYRKMNVKLRKDKLEKLKN